MIDIITVTYNSEKWIDGYFNSILLQKDICLKEINIILFDNCSKDRTVNRLQEYKEKYELHFAGIEIISSHENKGFSKGNNEASLHAKFDHLFFLNIDIFLNENNLSILKKEIQKSEPDFVAWELRQLPYEHSKYYNPVTLETSWASAAALVIQKDIYKQIGGFDSNYFMYCEDVDISWKIRLENKKIKYLPNCALYHYTYLNINEIKPIQYYYGIINNLFIRIKFGHTSDILKWFKEFLKIIRRRGPFPQARRNTIIIFMKEFHKVFTFLHWRYKNRKKVQMNSPGKFVGFNYELSRAGDFYYTIFPQSNRKVSILIRTYKRPDVLKRTLSSLRNQTYKNFEIVVVEDGGNTAEKIVKNDFFDLNITYYPCKKIGRCAAGNLAMEYCVGDLVCFLDDDDYFYPDYLETMVAQFERNPDTHIINSLAFRYEVETINTNPYHYDIKRIEIQDSPVFHLFRLCIDNYYPIQSIMFKRTLYEELGGFDEALDYYEDWNLWLKYTAKYPMYSVLKVCSVFKIPADRKTQQEREAKFHKNRKLALDRQKNIKITLDPFTLSELLKKY